LEPVTKLRLSDLFVHPDESHEFEWTATMYNLNKGKNDALLSTCKPLSDYMTLVNYIRENQSAGMPVKKAVDEAVKRCIKEDILRDFLKKHRAEVMNVCMTEYNEEVFVNSMIEVGRQEGRADSIRTLLRKGKTMTEIHDLLDYPMEEIVEVSKNAVTYDTRYPIR
jgi:hypothetical protein